MRILIINSFCGILSTGKICAKIAEEEIRRGNEVRIAYGRGVCPERYKAIAVKIGNTMELAMHILLTRIFDWHGIGLSSYFATRKFLNWVEVWRPDIVWIHNLHGYYINWPLLFRWLKAHPEIRIKWTFHDCWPFTGHCTYFTATNCGKWRGCCEKCPILREYPGTFFYDRVSKTHVLKKRMFIGFRDLTIITPSAWLGQIVKDSFLGGYSIEVQNNTIDRSVFKPTAGDVRRRLGLEGREIVLGVASTWDRRKGLDDFIALRSLLPSEIAIVLVGLSERQIKSIPDGILGLRRTHSAVELAELYSTADWFFNPTHEENYPTVNLEAVACGCRVVTYDTGGCRETVDGVSSAIVLEGPYKTPQAFAKIVLTLRNTKGVQG